MGCPLVVVPGHIGIQIAYGSPPHRRHQVVRGWQLELDCAIGLVPGNDGAVTDVLGQLGVSHARLAQLSVS